MTTASTSTSTSICPFTLKSIDEIERENLAVIYQNNPLLSSSNAGGDGDVAGNEMDRIPCGHSCTLSHLISYLHDTVGSNKSCPACQSSPASVVCDANSSKYLLRQRAGSQCNEKNEAGTPDSDGGRIISFRYGPTSYFLWVHSTPPSPTSSYYSKLFSSAKGNALDRIGSVLGMDVKTGLKLIHKGKVIFPETSGKKESYSTDEIISEQLLDITSTDLIHKRKKPSLVVMGLRQPANAMSGKSTTNILFGIVRRLTPSYIWNMTTWGVRFTFRTCLSLLGGIGLFVRSILYPPQPTHP